MDIAVKIAQIVGGLIAALWAALQIYNWFSGRRRPLTARISVDWFSLPPVTRTSLAYLDRLRYQTNVIDEGQLDSDSREIAEAVRAFAERLSKKVQKLTEPRDPAMQSAALLHIYLTNTGNTSISDIRVVVPFLTHAWMQSEHDQTITLGEKNPIAITSLPSKESATVFVLINHPRTVSLLRRDFRISFEGGTARCRFRGDDYLPEYRFSEWFFVVRGMLVGGLFFLGLDLFIRALSYFINARR